MQSSNGNSCYSPFVFSIFISLVLLVLSWYPLFIRTSVTFPLSRECSVHKGCNAIGADSSLKDSIQLEIQRKEAPKFQYCHSFSITSFKSVFLISITRRIYGCYWTLCTKWITEKQKYFFVAGKLFRWNLLVQPHRQRVLFGGVPRGILTHCSATQKNISQRLRVKMAYRSQ